MSEAPLTWRTEGLPLGVEGIVEPPPLSIEPAALEAGALDLPLGVAGRAYEAPVCAGGGVEPLAWRGRGRPLTQPRALAVIEEP